MKLVFLQYFTAKFAHAVNLLPNMHTTALVFYPLWEFCGSSMSFHDSWLHLLLCKVLETTNERCRFSFQSMPVYEENYCFLSLEFEFYMKSVWDFFVRMLQAYTRLNVSNELSIVSHT